MRHNVLTAALLLALAPAAQAATCSPSPAVAVQNYPGAARIQYGNNLAMPAGKSVEAEGQRVVIYGTLLDKNCVPVSDAAIELWQVDPFGKWILATKADLVTPNPVFTGAGRTRSDNAGQFHFVTLFPAALSKRAPHFNLRITMRGEKPFTTVLYFAEDGRNASDGVFKSMSVERRKQASMQVNEAGEAGLGARAEIVLPYATRYRGF